MARKARIEYAGACYHVLNRGNYRNWIFESEGARKSFLKCLAETCEAKGWRVHAWCLMVNHYHLLIETPEPNLVVGMKWLQSTFANRFNRFRKENGHVFQGRYKAILLDGDAIGTVCHYIHLNPVRAGLVTAQQLQEYRDSSFHQLWYPRKRWSFYVWDTCLGSAGGLEDKPKDRKLYRDYLDWLSESEPERKKLGFEKMCRGWAKGTKEFKKAVLKDEADLVNRRIVEAEAKEMAEPRWERGLKQGLVCLGRTESELKTERKGALWKVALCRHLRERFLVPNPWLAERLNMGTANSLSSLVSRHKSSTAKTDKSWKILKNQEYVD